MSQLLAITTNDDSLIECALAPYCDALSLITGDTGWWGMGYYHRGELLQRSEPRRQGEPLDVAAVVQGLRADLIVMHTRLATVGKVRRENTHPFRFKEWLFAHNGTILGFDSIKDKLMEAIPTFIRRNIKGETDSEHVFHLFLSFLYDAGVFGRPDAGVDTIGDALIRTVATVDEFAGVAGFEPSGSSFIVSDGYSCVVGSRGIPVDHVVIDGIEDCSVCRRSLQPGETMPHVVHHEDLKAVVIRSSDGPSPPGFKRIDDNSLLMVSSRQEVSLRRFE